MVTSSFTMIFFCSIGVLMVVWIAGCSAQGRNEGDSCQATPNVVGTCRMIAECKEEAKEIIRKGEKPALCGFKGIQPIVCCTQIDGISSKINAVGEKAKKHCEEYKKLCPSSSGPSGHLLRKRDSPELIAIPIEIPELIAIPIEIPELIAIPIEIPFEIPIPRPARPDDRPAIDGGVSANMDEFPHMAAIGYGDGEEVIWGCGGALISKNYVLTAAHCLWDPMRGPAKLVRLGAEVIEDTIRGSSLKSAKGQTHRVLERIIHPGYKRPKKYNDVALLKIDVSPIEGTKASNRLSWTIRPACLHYEGDFELVNGQAIATGWGRLGFGEDVSPELQKVSLSVLDNSLCNNTFDVEIRTTSTLPRGIDSSCICAGELGGGKDTCLGDSGGPLQLINYDGTCVTQLIGITSFGKVCGFENSPAVYMRVKHYVSWIESVVWS